MSRYRLHPLGNGQYMVTGVRVSSRTGRYLTGGNMLTAMTPQALDTHLPGRTIAFYETEDRNRLTLYFTDKTHITVRDPLGIHVGYTGYFDGAVIDSVEHVGHSTFIRAHDGSDLLRFVTVGWSKP